MDKGNAPQVQDHTDELFYLFDFMQKMNIEQAGAQIKDTGYPTGDGLSVSTDLCFYQIKKLAYDEEYPRREAFENVLNALDNEAYNFVYILSGNHYGVELYIGVVKNHRKNCKTLSTVNYGEIIKNAFTGNFNGSSLKRLEAEEIKEKLLTQAWAYKSAGIISGIPSMNKNESGEELDFQGIDRLINSMLGQNWRIAVICEPVSRQEILKMKEDAYELYNRLSVYSKVSVQKSMNEGSSFSYGKNESDSTGKNRNWSESNTETNGTANEDGTTNSSSSQLFGKGGGDSKEHSEGKNWSYNKNKGLSQAVTLEMANKHAQDMMQYIEEDLLPRIKQGYGKGMFRTSLYYMADKITTANRLKLSIMSLFQGSQSTFSPLLAQELNLKDFLGQKALRTFQNSYYMEKEYPLDAAVLLSKPADAQLGLGISSCLTAKEAGILAGLPQKEVPGIVLCESVDFGLNEHTIGCEDAIDLGVFVQKGRKLEIRFLLKKDSMMKHTFIAGVTGMGKTTTCHRLLAAADTPFLVIEPAKTEYRTLAQNERFGQVFVFTLGNESIAPFRLNPFELMEGEVISAHIDMLKAAFTSAFPMEASMPQILEEAMIGCYEEKGWNLDTNENIKYGTVDATNKYKCFPMMSDLLRKMKEIVKQKGFSAQMQADYEGSLVSRLSNLTVGAKGRILDCPYSIDFHFIAHNHVIIEMEELKSPEDKALFMGLILSRLSAVIKAEHKINPEFRHLTLIEEAHRLLAKADYGDSGAKKAAVETFTDLLAEIRKYGEGLIVVDQIPNKLAPEVLKNTNTKIVHKILARDDKEAVGDTMLMDDRQKEYLSALEPGYAIVFSEDTDKPVHVYVERETDTNEEEIDDQLIKKLFEGHRDDFGDIYEEPEILKVYELYLKYADKIRKRQDIDLEFFNMFKESIQNILKCNRLNGKEIFMRLYTRRERQLGYAIDEKLVMEMGEFLFEIYEQDRMVFKDLDYRKCRKIV